MAKKPKRPKLHNHVRKMLYLARLGKIPMQPGGTCLESPCFTMAGVPFTRAMAKSVATVIQIFACAGRGPLQGGTNGHPRLAPPRR
jgi:hypothetical protein